MPLPWFLENLDKAKYIYNNPDASYLILDFEATALPNGALNDSNDLVLACWSIHRKGKDVVHKYVFADEYGMGELLEDINSVNFIVAQGAKYELQWLKRCGVDLRNILVWDTMLAQWVLDGNLREPRNLAALAVRYGTEPKIDLISLLWATGMDTKDVPRSWLLEYCRRDVSVTSSVFHKQRRLIYERDQQHLVLSRCMTCSCLADIEFNGMTLDESRVNEELTRVTTQLADVEQQLSALTGGINLGSPKQLGHFLYEVLSFDLPTDRRGKPIRTGSGAYPTAAPIISGLKASTDSQRRFLSLYSSYNRLDTLLSKNLSFFKGVCEEYGGVFRAVFNQNITQTHRLSSSGLKLLFKGEKKAKGVQMQNIPREYKKLFWSGDDNYFIGEGDGAQLEFRVAVDLCRDSVGWDEIANDVDVHTVTANTLTAAGEPTSRQEAKSRTFRPLYGGKSGTPAEVAYVEFFNNKYEGISTTQRNWALTVVNEGKLRTPYGMEFYWPGTTISRTGYIDNTTSIYNYPVQGFATGEIIPIALVYFWHRSRDMDITILNTIHDSIISKVHKNEVEAYKELTRVSLTEDVFRFLKQVYEYDFITPLGAGVKVSRNWGDTSSETIYNVFPSGEIRTKEKN